MAAPTITGDQGTSLVKQLPLRVTRTDEGEVVVQPYVCDRDSVSSLIASADQFGDPHADFPDAILKRIEETKGPAFSRLEYIYEPASSRFGSRPGPPPVGDVSRSASANLMEVPIGLHSSWTQTWTDSKPGVEAFLAPFPVYQRTEVKESSNFTWNQAGIVENTGKLEAPTDVSGSPTATDWLKTGRDIQESGVIVMIMEEWTYNKDGWDTDIYATA